MNSFVINNVKIVTPNEVLENGFIYIRKGIIDVIEPSSNQKLHRSCNVIDGQGKWLLPGIVDMYSTALEKGLEPGEYLPFPLETVFDALDNRLVSNGITTVYHALSSGTGSAGLFSSEDDGSGGGSGEIRLSRLGKNGSIRHSINILHDIGGDGLFSLLENLIDRKELQLISIMPGGVRGDDPDRRLHKNELRRISDFIEMLAEKARKYEIRIASYREDSRSRISHMKKLGVKILEFPQGPGIAAEAVRLGMSVLSGAPDIVRGAPDGGKGCVPEAVLNDSSHMLCSENIPASLINAVFLLYRSYDMDMAEAFRKVSINPARALGIDRRVGSIECGKLADMALVREAGGKPFVEKVFINGFKVFEKNNILQSGVHFYRLVHPKPAYNASGDGGLTIV